MGVWYFIQDQVPGMRWLSDLIGMVLSALGLDVEGQVGGSIHFFLYDVLKIAVLICVLIFAVSYVQSYFPPERSKRILGRFHGISTNLIAALLGTVTPFCSCSSIPLFIGFSSAGLPLGVTFSFLISSPMVDLGSLVLLMKALYGIDMEQPQHSKRLTDLPPVDIVVTMGCNVSAPHSPAVTGRIGGWRTRRDGMTPSFSVTLPLLRQTSTGSGSASSPAHSKKPASFGSDSAKRRRSCFLSAAALPVRPLPPDIPPPCGPPWPRRPQPSPPA